MVELGTAKSEIREAFAFAQARAAEIGPENVDDFSIGNPSVPAPDTVAQMVHQLVDTVDPILLHGYTPAQGDAAVRQALADDLNRRYGTDYDPDCFYLTAGAAGASSGSKGGVSPAMGALNGGCSTVGGTGWAATGGTGADVICTGGTCCGAAAKGAGLAAVTTGRAGTAAGSATGTASG